jgi:circadian clock protein KaiC
MADEKKADRDTVPTPEGVKQEAADNLKERFDNLKPQHIKMISNEVKKQREPIKEVIDNAKHPRKPAPERYVRTGIAGLDELIVDGIPKGASIIVAGGAGSGKTLMCLQILVNAAKKGKKCLYMSFEESESKLKQHMEDFGWDYKALEKSGNLMIKRFNPFDITRNVDALLAKAMGELLIDVKPVILPQGFNPDFIIVDSLTAIGSAFTGKEESYRIYIEQLFRFFETLKATSFMITETDQIPTSFSPTGVEEFLADGVIVLYSIRRGNIRENAIEVLKLRGAKHEKKIVAFQVISGVGVEIYPEQEVFADFKEE